MKNLKVILSGVLSAAIICSINGSIYASPINSEPINNVSIREKSLYTSDGKLLGSVKRKTTVEISKKGKSVLFNVMEDDDYQLESEYANIKEYREKFSDSIKKDSYELTSDKKLYANGKLVDENMNSFTALSGDTGGVPAYSHYYSTSDWSSYTFASYSDVDWTGTGTDFIRGAGSNIQRTTTPSNSFFNSAKSSVDSFEDNYNDFKFNNNALLASLGLLLLTWETVIGAIAAGGSAAITAVQIVDNFNDMEDDIGDAYDYISHF